MPRQRLDFEFVDEKDVTIADEFIEGVFERYDEVLPQLLPEQMPPRTPVLSPPRLVGWKTPPEVERIVPKPKTPPPSPPYVMKEMKPHEWFERPPSAPATFDQSVLMETPPGMAPSPPPASPRRTPPRRASPVARPVSPLPSIFGQTPPHDLSFDADVCMPCTPPGISPGKVEDIFAGAGISPARPRPPTPPSPPSPYSTEEAMQQMKERVLAAEGRSGIALRMPTWPDIERIKPMGRIREAEAQPGVGTLGLPGIVQVDFGTLGTGQREETPYVSSPYFPPRREPPPVQPAAISPPCARARVKLPPPPLPLLVQKQILMEKLERLQKEQMMSPETLRQLRKQQALERQMEQEEQVQQELSQLYETYGVDAAQIPAEEVTGVCPTSPLAQYSEGVVISPPRRSPTLPKMPAGAPVLEQTVLSFEDLEVFDRLPSTPLRTPQVTPKPSPYLSPYPSPGYTPPCRVLSPQLPAQRPDETFLSDYSGPTTPEYYPSPEQRIPSPALSPISPQYMAPEWVEASTVSGDSSVEQEEDEMGLPGLVQLYAQHMVPIYASPTEQRERRIITWEDQPAAPVRPQMIHPAAEVHVEALPAPEEQVDLDIPIAPLEPFVPKTSVPSPRYDLSPPLPQYAGATLDEDYDMGALYAGEYGAYEMYEAASIPSVGGTPSPQRQLPARTPSPRTPPIPRSPPRTIQKWDQLLDETRRSDKFATSIDYAASPQQLSPCGPCGASPPLLPSPARSPARSPMTVRSPAMRSPVAQVARSPVQVSRSPPRMPSPPAVARSPAQLARIPSPPQARSPVRPPPSPVRTPPRSPPIVMPQLSPFRLPQPSPPCGPCGPVAKAPVTTSPERIVKQTTTQKKIVTVIPPQPSEPLQFEGEILEPFGGDMSDSDIQEEDADFRWMD